MRFNIERRPASVACFKDVQNKSFLSSLVLKSKSLVTENLETTIPDPRAKDGDSPRIACIQSDIGLILRAKAGLLDDDALMYDLRQLLDGSSSSVVDELSKMSDDELLDSIKPRYVQTASELRNWIQTAGDTIKDRLSEYVSEQELQVAANDDGASDSSAAAGQQGGV